MVCRGRSCTYSDLRNCRVPSLSRSHIDLESKPLKNTSPVRVPKHDPVGLIPRKQTTLAIIPSLPVSTQSYLYTSGIPLFLCVELGVVVSTVFHIHNAPASVAACAGLGDIVLQYIQCVLPLPSIRHRAHVEHQRSHVQSRVEWYQPFLLSMLSSSTLPRA